MALVSPPGEERCFEGRVRGSITEGLQGSSGFGYDPLFQVEGRTFAEMSPEEKNRRSHRARALEALRQFLDRLPG
jgi:XTP/dITP diphosphohydrolase